MKDTVKMPGSEEALNSRLLDVYRKPGEHDPEYVPQDNPDEPTEEDLERDAVITAAFQKVIAADFDRIFPDGLPNHK